MPWFKLRFPVAKAERVSKRLYSYHLVIIQYVSCEFILFVFLFSRDHPDLKTQPGHEFCLVEGLSEKETPDGPADVEKI